MSNYNPSSSGRRSGRGPRRGRDRDQEARGPRGTYAVDTSKSSAPAKQSLLQKIIGFFTGGGKPATPAAKERPQYTPRSASRDDSAARDRAPRSEPRPERAERPARQSRKPEAIEVTTPKVYVGNLSFDAGESDLSELFNGVGTVVTSEIVTHKQTEKSKGFGFVTLSSVDEAKRAVEILHDKEFMGRKLVVSGAKTPMERE